MRMGFWAAIALALAACSPPNADKAANAAALRAPTTDETRIVGPVTSIEDGGYPQFTVHVQQDARDLALYLDAEDADLGGQPPQSFSGKTAAIYFKRTPENNLAEIRLAGQSLINGTDEPAGPSVTGVLSGAEAVTNGDLPDQIAVTDAAGNRTVFEYYVTPEIVAANGREVTAFYTPSEVSRVTLMRPAR